MKTPMKMGEKINWSSKSRAIAPNAPLVVTNLLKYKYLHVETNYQTNSRIQGALAALTIQ
uniref:Uncharacterized protein n=1 Tax=Arundo donax TaxID=35708 RepID=A0A0A9HHR0_ARUDO